MFLLTLFAGVFIYEQASVNGNLAQYVGFPNAAGASLAGSAVIGWVIFAMILVLCATLYVMQTHFLLPVPTWSYELKLGSLLWHMWHVEGKRRWWFVGVPGGLFLPLAPYSIDLMGSLPTVVFSLLGWALYAANEVRRSPEKKVKYAWLGLGLTSGGAILCIIASSLGVKTYSDHISGYWFAPIITAAGAAIMWQLLTLGQMGNQFSRLAASLVSWKGGTVTALVAAVAVAAVTGGAVIAPLSQWPSPIEHPDLYLGMVYGVGIILIGAITSKPLRALRFIIALTAGYALDGFLHAFVGGMQGAALLLGVATVAMIIMGVGMTVRVQLAVPPLQKAA